MRNVNGATDAATVDPVPGLVCGAELQYRLRADGPVYEDAVRELHALMLRAARHQITHTPEVYARLGSGRVEHAVSAAADEATMAVLARLDAFEGRSQFTTWAYKFAILQAATEVRRQSWAQREVTLEDWETWCDPQPVPEQEAEASDLASAVERAMTVALTPYQRKIAVALLVDQVPIDVLAERLGTTRGALYKALHEARGRLRAHLVATGYLAVDDRRGATR